MTRTMTLAIVAAAALAGCNQANTDAATETNTAEVNTPIELPPAIAATKLYRCADNSVVTVDYLADNKTANVRIEGQGPVQVAAAEPGQPMTAEGGYSVEGSADAATAKIAVAGKPAQTCRS